jgi:hypothetical protein
VSEDGLPSRDAGVVGQPIVRWAAELSVDTVRLDSAASEMPNQQKVFSAPDVKDWPSNVGVESENM